MSNAIAVIVLIIAILGTSLGLVYSKHQSRQLTAELQMLLERRDELEIDWEQLLLERRTLSTESEVDEAARTYLDMVVPDPDAVIYLLR